jgi:hypothetical protein
MSDELLTILFTDMEGSTTLHVATGDAEPPCILGACDAGSRWKVWDAQVTGQGEVLVPTLVPAA